MVRASLSGHCRSFTSFGEIGQRAFPFNNTSNLPNGGRFQFHRLFIGHLNADQGVDGLETFAAHFVADRLLQKVRAVFGVEVIKYPSALTLADIHRLAMGLIASPNDIDVVLVRTVRAQPLLEVVTGHQVPVVPNLQDLEKVSHQPCLPHGRTHLKGQS